MIMPDWYGRMNPRERVLSWIVAGYSRGELEKGGSIADERPQINRRPTFS